MKFTIKVNIEKRHVYLLVAVLVLLSSLIFVISSPAATGAFHDILYTKEIRGNGQDFVSLMDSLIVQTNAGQNFLTIQATGNSNSGIRFINGPAMNNFIFNEATTGNMKFQTENTDRVVITKQGNIGIGTTTPTQKLEVNGAIKESNAGGLFYGSTPGNFGGKELVITANNGQGLDNDEIWIGPNTGAAKGNIQLTANKIHLNAPGGVYVNGNIPSKGTLACRRLSAMAVNEVSVTCAADEDLTQCITTNIPSGSATCFSWGGNGGVENMRGGTCGAWCGGGWTWAVAAICCKIV